MSGFENKGLDELTKQLNDLRNRTNELDGEHPISFSELFTDDFVSRFTDYQSLDEMFNDSGFKIDSMEDFQSIPDELWNEFIRTHSQFNCWEEMRDAAMNEWTAKQLGF